MRDYKIIDSIIFNNELEMLKMRLDYYYDSVDYFVICESTKTQSGNDKNLSYEVNSHLFEEYKDKIYYVVYIPTEQDLEKLKEDKFFLESEHRECLRNKVKELSDENTLILLSDVDEFPKKELFDEARSLTKDLNMDAVSFKLKTFYYSPRTELLINCYATVAVNDYTLRNVDRFYDLRRYTFNCSHIENGGYHLSFFMTPEEIQRKIMTYSHQEFNNPEYTDIEKIKYRMYNGLDMFERPECPTVHYDRVSDEFPMELYRHEIFFRNTFDRAYLKHHIMGRRNRAMQIPLEIENLQLSVNNHKPKVIVEIGTANGGTLARWFEIPSVETIISIDYPIGGHGGQGFEERTYVISDAIEQANVLKKEFYAINGDSKNEYLVDRLEELLNGRKVDFLFIDGDHTYYGVSKDYEIYEKFLSENSIVGFHDILDSEFHRVYNCFVSTLWNELKEQYESKEFVYPEFVDKKILEMMYNLSEGMGGFGGIGIIEHSKKKELIADIVEEKEINHNISLVVPIHFNVPDTINNVTQTLECSKNINQVILYSNGTNDEGNQQLQEFADTNPIIELYVIPEALGFIKAVNESFKKCKNEYMLCLNSDAVLFSNWEELILDLCKNEENGLIGPVLCDDFILGCCFMAKKSVLNKIGLLNEGLGMGYYDDNDLSGRVIKNGYKLGYSCEIKSNIWDIQSNTTSDTKGYVSFPINHVQGVSFANIKNETLNKQKEHNRLKVDKFLKSNAAIVLKDLQYDDIKNKLNDDDVFIVINKSGENFERIRFDEDIIRMAHIFECTNEMNIDVLINSVTKGKKIKIISTGKENNLTWLAKIDDYTSMGILSQRILEKLTDTDITCKSILGDSDTNNPLIHNWLSKDINNNLGIMFSYPDMYNELNKFKTRVIYTGVDTTGGIPNFASNSNNADFLLTPSNISKNRMIELGVTKPIFVFPHGIDENKFTYTEKSNDGKFKFLYVGEASDRKGIFHLLKAFNELFADNLNVELHMKSNMAMLFYCGDDVKDIVDKSPNIFWDISDEGHDKTLELYKECHAYVYPSRADTFGMTVLEAMACGLAVISTSEPGSTELIKGRYYEVPTKQVPVIGHPWMTGTWGEPNIDILKKHMLDVYVNYDKILSKNTLKDNSDFVRQNYSWTSVVNDFENHILPQLTKEIKILTLVTSYNRPNHIKNVINSLKDIRERGVQNDVYIVENSTSENKEEIVNIINENIDSGFKLYVSDFNMGQRGALLQMLDDVNIDDYDYIQFTDQDNVFNEPLSTYCGILMENQDVFFVTGYMSKEHTELAWRKTKYGRLCEKRSLRAGHMFLRVKDIKSLYPIHLDGQYGQAHNSSWYAGLDWELSYWNPNAFARRTDKNFVLCVPGGVLHKGIDSTFYEWPVEENEYPLDELVELRAC
jgi:glycosyltransferase involved in cell wall biosynthesis/GT2 family glycosyltransferase/cephalosporin hydroxylase